jgi:uncharacterized membrane protein
MERLLLLVVKPQVLPLKRLLKGFGLGASGFCLCSFRTTAASGFTVFPITAFVTSVYIAVHEFPLKE